MTTCNLTKPESTFDAIRKSHKDLKPTDAALVATALVQAGKFADCVYDGKTYQWTSESYKSLAEAYMKEVDQVNLAEVDKKAPKNVEPESVTLTVHLRPSVEAAERVLGRRNDLKTLVSDLLTEGVEFLYSPTDIGWPWTLERVNWATESHGDLKRRIKFRAEFEAPCEAIELSSTGKRKK